MHGCMDHAYALLRTATHIGSFVSWLPKGMLPPEQSQYITTPAAQQSTCYTQQLVIHGA